MKKINLQELWNKFNTEEEDTLYNINDCDDIDGRTTFELTKDKKLILSFNKLIHRNRDVIRIPIKKFELEIVKEINLKE